MKLSNVAGVLAVLLLGSAANAQTGRPDQALATQRGLQPGMVVTDRAGVKVAIISKVDQIRDGRPAVRLNVNGSKFQVLASRFTLSPKGDEAITSLTGSEIRTLEIDAD